MSASSKPMVLSVRVKPGARQDKIEKTPEGDLVVKVRARPVDGEANNAVIESLSDFFSVAKSRIELVSGPKSKIKRFAISLQASDDKERIENLLQKLGS